MAIKKSELYGSLWRSCDELRGGMDASQYKDYVLALLFVKYVSDKYAGQRDALIDVPAGGGFADMVALKGDKEIGEKINKIIGRLAEANDLKGVIDVADFNDADKLGKGKEMVDRLSNLISIFNTPALDFRGNRAEGDDILGDAYEYLMKNFATQSGKSKGQFYTPAEVSRIMAKVIGIGGAGSSDQAIYDPTCGSGSLLLKAHDEAPVDVTIYGQEMDNATAALAKMNMILHDCPTAEIWQDNTLSEPHFKNGDGCLKTFDYAVANPPFSTKAWSNGFDPANDLYGRFAYGIPPAPEVTPEVGKMLGMFEGEMNRQQIMAKLGLRDEKHFREHYQQAAIASGAIEMTVPEKPNSRHQKYRLTEAGKQWLAKNSKP